MDIELINRLFSPIIKAAQSVEKYIFDSEQKENKRLLFGDRAGVFVSTLNLSSGVTHVLPPGGGYLLVSTSGDATTIRIAIGEQTIPQAWPLGIFVRTGERHDKQVRAYVSATIGQQIQVLVCQGGCDVRDSRSFMQAMDPNNLFKAVKCTSRAQQVVHPIGMAFIAGGVSNVPTAIAALGTDTALITGSGVINTLAYTIDLRISFSATAAGWVKVTLKMTSGADLAVFNIFVPLAGAQVLDLRLFEFVALSSDTISVQTTSLLTYAGDYSFTASVPTRVF